MTTIMRRLADLPIWSRIAIVCLIPLLAFTGFAGKDMLEKARSIAVRQQRRGSDRGRALDFQPGPRASEGTRKLGRIRLLERQALAETMRNQRPVTDEALARWGQRMVNFDRVMLGGKFGRSLDGAQSALETLGTTRSAIDAVALSVPKTVEYFTATIANLVATIQATGDLTENVGILRQSIAFSAFVQRKEFAGQARVGRPGLFVGRLRARRAPRFHPARRHAGGAGTDFREKRPAGPNRGG
jgi:hypothetical protein